MEETVPTKDIERDLWKLHAITQEDGLRVPKYGLSWDTRVALRSGEIYLHITNEAAWVEFEGKVGTRWTVSLVPTPA